MDITNDLKNMVGTIKDTVNEAVHKSSAEAEHARRDAAGDTMTTGEKAGSIVNEATNNVQAQVDHAKVEARKEI
jgi:F0F1-type ATP synthase membrane subunit b/b'